MFEIWWKDRLIDVVPAVSDVPAGLTVRSREALPVERVKGETPDWRFSKVLAMCLLTFVACVMVMTLTPIADGDADDGMFKGSLVAKIVLPPIPPKKVPVATKFTSDTVKALFADRARPNQRVSVSSILNIWDEGTRGVLGGGGGPSIDALLNNLSGGGGGGADGRGLGGPRGGGPGMGPGFSLGGGPIGRRPQPGGQLGGKKDDGPTSGPVRISDGLPRDLVAKVIRAHANEIKYCYERELQHTPGLSGKVGISFTIGPSGEVIEAAVSESTIDNSAVEECMLSRVKRWKFPDPAGGGTVEVNHPWIFRGAGDNDP